MPSKPKPKFVVLELPMMLDCSHWREKLNAYPDYRIAASHIMGDYFIVILERD